jgi:putative membrane protein
MITKKLSIAVLYAGLAIATVSCSNHEKDSKETAKEMNEAKFDKEGEKEADKLVHAYSSNLYEIRASENAAMNATTPEVKKLAGMLVEAHTKMNEDVKNLAAGKGVTLPTDLSDEQRQHMEKLTEKSGIEYDKAYTEQMKKKHEDAIEFYEKTAEKCDDADIKAWANNTVPEVRSHFDMVMSSYNLVKDRK